MMMPSPSIAAKPARITLPRRRARGFTLIETTLAMVLGAMVLAGCLGVFVAIRRMDSTFETRYQRTSELDITHTIISRAMLGLQMEETQTNPVSRAPQSPQNSNATSPDGDPPSDEPAPRPRLILETDPSVMPDSSGWIPQRLELVNATPPVPQGLATQAAGWYTAQNQSDSLDFSAMDGSQGAVRGVFEFRQGGQRERVMEQLGLIAKGDPILREARSPDTNPQANPMESPLHESKPNWTLWWRPILSYEGQQLLGGQPPMSDSTGTPDEIRARLAGAVPLMHGIERGTWQLFKGDEFVDSYTGLTMGDLPAYTLFEVILNNSQYASWMFEVDWVLGDDPSQEVLATGNTDEPGTNGTNTQPGTNGDTGNGNGNGNTNGRPGGRPPDRVIDFSGGP